MPPASTGHHCLWAIVASDARCRACVHGADAADRAATCEGRMTRAFAIRDGGGAECCTSFVIRVLHWGPAARGLRPAMAAWEGVWGREGADQLSGNVTFDAIGFATAAVPGRVRGVVSTPRDVEGERRGNWAMWLARMSRPPKRPPGGRGEGEGRRGEIRPNRSQKS